MSGDLDRDPLLELGVLGRFEVDLFLQRIRAKYLAYILAPVLSLTMNFHFLIEQHQFRRHVVPNAEKICECKKCANQSTLALGAPNTLAVFRIHHFKSIVIWTFQKL